MLQHHAIVAIRARSLAVRWTGHGRDLRHGVHARQGGGMSAGSWKCNWTYPIRRQAVHMVLPLIG